MDLKQKIEEFKNIYRKGDVLVARPTMDGSKWKITYKDGLLFIRVTISHEKEFEKYQPLDWLVLLCYICDVEFTPLIQVAQEKYKQENAPKHE